MPRLVTAAMVYLTLLGGAHADQKLVNQLLMEYQQQGANQADIKAGKALWSQEFVVKKGKPSRSCTNCHGSDLSKNSTHIRTGKTILAMAPDVNPKRLNKRRTVEKWFKRNCKWTIGRECSPQEKADFLVYINTPTKK